jgi:hypothetical protein
MHRFSGNLKGKLAVEITHFWSLPSREEESAKEAYQKALKENAISEPVRQILVTQQSRALQSHDQVKAFRDRKAAYGEFVWPDADLRGNTKACCTFVYLNVLTVS